MDENKLIALVFVIASGLCIGLSSEGISGKKLVLLWAGLVMMNLAIYWIYQ